MLELNNEYQIYEYVDVGAGVGSRKSEGNECATLRWIKKFRQCMNTIYKSLIRINSALKFFNSSIKIYINHRECTLNGVD